MNKEQVLQYRVLDKAYQNIKDYLDPESPCNHLYHAFKIVNHYNNYHELLLSDEKVDDYLNPDASESGLERYEYILKQKGHRHNYKQLKALNKLLMDELVNLTEKELMGLNVNLGSAGMKDFFDLTLIPMGVLRISELDTELFNPKVYNHLDNYYMIVSGFILALIDVCGDKTLAPVKRISAKNQLNFTYTL